MGLGFRPPPSSKVKEWRLLADAMRDGKTFHCCCGSAQPKTLLELRELLSQQSHYRRLKNRG